MLLVTSKIQNYLLYLFVFLLPWQTIFILREVFFDGEKWQYGTIGLYFSDIFIVLFLIYTYFCSKNHIIIYIKKHAIIVLTAMLFVLFSFLSTFWASDSLLSLYFSTKLFFALCLFFALQISNYNTKTLSLFLILGVFFQSFIGFFQFTTQNTFSFKYLGLQHYNIWQGGTSIVTAESGRWLRSYGGQTHPNILALLSLIAILLSIYLYISLQKKSLLLKSFLLISMSLFTSTMLFSFSRNIWLSFFVAFLFEIVFLFLNYRNLFKNILIPLILIFFTSFFLIFTYKDLFFTRISHDTLKTHNSISDRLLYIKQAKKLISKNFLKGIGAGNYTNSVYNLEKRKYPIWYCQPVHNIYLLILAEIGFIGSLLFAFFILLNLKVIYLQKNKFKPEQIIFLIIFSLFLLLSLFDHFLWTSHIGLFLLFLIFGICIKTFEN